MLMEHGNEFQTSGGNFMQTMKKTYCFVLLALSVFHANLGFSQNLIRSYSKEQKQQIYSLLPFQKIETFLSYQAAKELEVPLMVQAIDRTRLASGSVEFARLMQPTSDLNKLNNRRQILEKLLKNNSKLFDELEETLFYFQKHEDLFISLFDKDVLPDKSVGQQLGLGISGVLFSLLRTGDAKRHIVSDKKSMTQQTGWLRYANLWRSMALNFVGGLAVLYQSGEQLRQAYQTIKEVDQFLSEFAQVVMLLEKTNQIIQTSPTLAQFFPAFSDFKELSIQHTNLAWTLEKLNQRTLNENVIWQYLHTISLYDQIRALKSDFANGFWWISRIDAYLSVIRWIKERQNNGEPITFATYNLTANRPEYHLKELYNPLFENAIPSDFEAKEHVVLTGPHALGKTSGMRSIAYAHIMAQSITVVPAQEAYLAPLEALQTYFNIGDSNGESSFQAELRRMTEMLALSKQNTHGKPMLFLIDEPFAKTPSRIGNNLMERFLNKTIDIQNLGLILSTHLEYPSSFAKTRPDRMQNLQPEIQSTPSGFKTTYRIMPGAADWWLENKNNETHHYIEWLIKKEADAAELWF